MPDSDNIRYNILEHRDEIITDIIKKLLWVPIAAIIPIVGSIIKHMNEVVKISQFKTNRPEIILSIVAIGLSILTTIGVVIFSRKYKGLGRVIEQEDSQNESKNIIDINQIRDSFSRFQFDEIEAELFFKSRTEIISTIRYHMIISSESENEFVKDIVWTGSKYKSSTITQMDGNYTLVDNTRKQSPYRYKVLFNEDKKFGDKLSFTIVTEVEDANLDMIPMYSYRIVNHINKLTLKVSAPNNLIENVTKSICADQGGTIVLQKPKSITRDTTGNLSSYKYIIKNPQFLYTYFINWGFTNE